MLERAEELTGAHIPITLADGGYHTAANLEAGKRRGQTLVMTERHQDATKDPYFKDNFVYDAATDSYTCPQGHCLHFRGLRKSNYAGSKQYRVYAASRTDCRACPVLGICTKDTHAGRALWIGPSDILLRKHRQWMKTNEARRLYARRQELNEPTFGILKEQLGARHFLLRGLENVRAEFTIMAAAFNLRVLSRIRNRISTAYQVVSKLQHQPVTENVLNLFKIILYFYDELLFTNPKLYKKTVNIITF
jgi:hypothetical protein